MYGLGHNLTIIGPSQNNLVLERKRKSKYKSVERHI